MARRADRAVLLIEPRFLSSGDCARVRLAMDRGAADAAEIAAEEIVTRDTIRRTSSIDIEPGVRDWLERRVDEFRPAVERALGRLLGSREGVGFLRYPAGGFYLTHCDRGDVKGWPGAARRAASVVVFLNGSGTESRNGDFEGGLLRLYPDSTREPVEITPEPGLLVAFPSELLHEVLPVRRGIRDAAVDWFYDR